MIEIKEDNKNMCCACNACYSICPKRAITMIEDDKGFKYPVIDKSKCVNCGLCEKVCPILNNRQKNSEPEVWAMYNTNLEERMNSSSGGIFTLIAKEIISRNGIVFGAMFDEDFNVYHSYIEDEKDIYKLQGSKYVQSNIGDSYKDVRKFLEEDRYVLFTGTSCQIEGLYEYLMKDYKKLYTQDIVCHGVPSPKVWQAYKNYLINKNKEKINSYSFRNKDNGWNKYQTKVLFEKKKYEKTYNEDLYMKAFLRNTCLRDSCYNCKFKNEYRNSDITLADFWGVSKVMNEINDNKGVSLVLINSQKGKEIFNIIKKDCIYKKGSFEYIKKYNTAYIKSSIKDPKRDEFFNNLDLVNFNELVNKYVTKTKKKSTLKRAFKKIKQIIKNN